MSTTVIVKRLSGEEHQFTFKQSGMPRDLGVELKANGFRGHYRCLMLRDHAKYPHRPAMELCVQEAAESQTAYATSTETDYGLHTDSRCLGRLKKLYMRMAELGED
ncbi:hypothetical protein IWW55_002839 [Coemansia sp. RSA 2706]|nr:hypothetical protein IWW55_002839 [Coemansia sp. RSA 2706]KAJ2328548.1 hypothetical protein IWW51_001135 [Coemansia sp. RSA 2702]KAJ2738068.1 hypothetical protein H4R23_001409 [Coemansia sp. Cherry 401B]